MAPGRTRKVRVELAQLDEGEGVCVRACGRELAVFKVEGRLYAIQNRCPHQDASLAEGELDGLEILCPLHSWSFDLRSGERLDAPTGHRVEVFAVERDGADLVVSLPDDER
ncbi:MAG: Rieske 2Fe-2S domain-containing protein [Myxococcales bacterium]|nr:Rieske 2Fe-2S domain-containing protein [Myxococcales bacterium]